MENFLQAAINQKMGDFQQRGLCGIVPMNNFISVLNPEVTQDCPFCSQRETVFHAFSTWFEIMLFAKPFAGL